MNAAYLLRFAAPDVPGAREALLHLALPGSGEPPAVRAWAASLAAAATPAQHPGAALLHQRSPRQVLAEAAAPLDAQVPFCGLEELGAPPPPLPWQLGGLEAAAAAPEPDSPHQQPPILAQQQQQAQQRQHESQQQPGPAQPPGDTATAMEVDDGSGWRARKPQRAREHPPQPEIEPTLEEEQRQGSGDATPGPRPPKQQRVGTPGSQVRASLANAAGGFAAAVRTGATGAAAAAGLVVGLATAAAGAAAAAVGNVVGKASPPWRSKQPEPVRRSERQRRLTFAPEGGLAARRGRLRVGGQCSLHTGCSVSVSTAPPLLLRCPGCR